MSNRTREINKITTTIISISVKLIVYALIVLLLYEAVARGYAFGHEIFYAEAVEEAPGHDMVVQMTEGESVRGSGIPGPQRAYQKRVCIYIPEQIL